MVRLKPDTTHYAVVAAQRLAQTVTGTVLEVKPAERTMLVSHDPIAGLMPAMIS